jgi:hypothetical protein
LKPPLKQQARNSRWGGDNDRDIRDRTPPKARNSRWGGDAEATSTTEAPREKTEAELKKEAELDARIKAIRERNKAGARAKTLDQGVKLDPFGNPIKADSTNKKKPELSEADKARLEKEKAVDARIAAVRAKNAAIKAGTWVEPEAGAAKVEHKGSEKLAALEASMNMLQGPQMPLAATLLEDMGVSAEDRAAIESFDDARKEKLAKKTKSMLREFLAGHDTTEFLLCLDELECKAYYQTVLMQAMTQIVEGFKQSERDGMKKLLPVLREKAIDADCLAAVMNDLGERMEDIKMDAPNVRIVARALRLHNLPIHAVRIAMRTKLYFSKPSESGPRYPILNEFSA